MELPFDRLLKVCANDLIDETLWSELDQFQHNGEKVQVSFKQVLDLYMLRFKSQSEALTEGLNLSSVPRPEVFCNDAVLRKHGLCDPGCVYHLEHLLAPGDVIVQRTNRREFHQYRHKVVSQAALLTGDSPVDSQSVEVRDQFCTRARGPVQRADERVLETDEPAQEVMTRHRTLTWRDYPQPKMATMAGIPWNPVSGTFVTQVGSEIAWVVVMAPDEAEVTNVIVGLFISSSTFPSWASNLMTQMVYAMHELFQARMMETKCISCSEALLREDQNLYVVLSLRTCPQGRPLVPCATSTPDSSVITVKGTGSVGRAAELTTWMRPSGTFSFPSYLIDLLLAIGCDDVRVFDCLDGRQLVPYQAVATWRAEGFIARGVGDVWSTHRVAYKRLNGCKHAPTIVDGRQPREGGRRRVYPGSAGTKFP
ncbi:unnamed protein product [Durusdinium trenchii]|uniref:Uncharacterized protein n=1 Tax=Durusdinium trenchii TaxID=1381693 RepID=A0ABP0LBB4_9DINO